MSSKRIRRRSTSAPASPNLPDEPEFESVENTRAREKQIDIDQVEFRLKEINEGLFDLLEEIKELSLGMNELIPDPVPKNCSSSSSTSGLNTIDFPALGLSVTIKGQTSTASRGTQTTSSNTNNDPIAPNRSPQGHRPGSLDPTATSYLV